MSNENEEDEDKIVISLDTARNIYLISKLKGLSWSEALDYAVDYTLIKIDPIIKQEHPI